jgi:uncharacterized protein
MLLDISNMGDTGLSFEESLRLTAVATEAPDLVEAPEVRFKGTVSPGPSLRNPAEGAGLNGEIDGTLRMRCSRCLESVDVPCHASFRFILVAEIPEQNKSEDAAESERVHFFEIRDGRLALDAVAAEQVYLEMPLKPLCEKSCAGLCPTCGINRNRLECACRHEDVDPRLAVLQEIRDRMSES